jgi:hypothetical protein
VFADLPVSHVAFLPSFCDFSLLCARPNGAFTLLQSKLQSVTSQARKSLHYHKSPVTSLLLTPTSFYSAD